MQTGSVDRRKEKGPKRKHRGIYKKKAEDNMKK
jgi:hypothetical protein